MEIYDREAKKLSIMHKQKYICNGQRDGRICKHYWRVASKVESINPEALREGESFRSCLVVPGQFIEMAGEEVRVQCNMYKGRKLPILQRPLAVLGLVEDPFLYDSKADEYNPLTPEQIGDLNAMRTGPMPTFPVRHSADPVHSIEALKAELQAKAAENKEKTAEVKAETAEVKEKTAEVKAEIEANKMSAAEIKAAMADSQDGDEDAGKEDDT